ncbi:MAG TPA: hypothetical protein VME20_11230 [Acidimicrobiales bacterium]|nr:hypothetical protein [Acidimicrobiales bacterium]
MGTAPVTARRRDREDATRTSLAVATGERHRLKQAGLLACLLGSGILLAACGGGPSAAKSVAHVGTTTTTTVTTAAPAPAQGGGGTGAAGASAAGVKFATCMRSHGEPDFPDSAVQVTPSGGVMFHLTEGSGVDPNSPTFKSAMQTCQSLIPHVANGGAPSVSATDKLLKYAQCMRSHGVPDFPEPNANGQIMVQVTGGAANNPLNPSSPQFQSASQACRSLQPPGLSGF